MDDPKRRSPSKEGSGGFGAVLARLKAARLGKGSSSRGGSKAGDTGGSMQRQSSDTTLHPVGCPSSLPSVRSSFESCVNDAPMSDPTYSQRESLDDSNVTALAAAFGEAAAGVHGSEAAAPGTQFAAVAMAARSSFLQPSAGLVPHAGSSPPPGALGAFCTSMPLTPASSSADSRESQGRQHLQAGSISAHLDGARAVGTRRHTSGRHPANLEHGSSAPAGAIDEASDPLLAPTPGGFPVAAASGSALSPGAASRQAFAGRSSDVNCHSSATPAHGAHAFGVAPAGHGSPAAGSQLSLEARLELGRRSAPAAHSAAAVGAEPQLSSQVALLAQQLLQQQVTASTGVGAGSVDSAVMLQRHSFHLGSEHHQQQHPQQQSSLPPRPRSLDTTRASPVATPLRSATSAAQMLVLGASPNPNSSSGPWNSGPQPGLPARSSSTSLGAVLGLAQLDAACQHRFPSPAPPEEPDPSPFSTVQGVYGCHLLPPTDVADPLPAPSPRVSSRSSIDLLLDPVLPATALGSSHRQSLDTVQELFATPLTPAPIGVATPHPTTMNQLPQQLLNQVRNSTGSSGGHRVIVRHSMDEVRRPPSSARPPGMLGSARRSSRGAAGDPSASFYRHISSGAMHDLANSTVTVVAGAVPVPAPATARSVTVTAHASSMVDPAAQPVAGTFEARIGTPEDSMFDPELHDTFGAHPSYGLPYASPPSSARSGGGHRRTASGGSTASEFGRATGGNTPPASSGWRQPSAAPRRLSSDAPRGFVAAAGPSGVATGPHQPIVYQPHRSDVSSTPLELSPIGNAMMLEPTAIPGQHSITVHDPQIIVPSLNFLKQRALARQKLERIDRQQSDANDAAIGSGAMGSGGSGGYIAEAKRVLAAAVHMASAEEAATVETSCSGAIGPLLRYLRDNKHNDAALRSGLHTLSLLVSNSPNRGIIVSFQGQAMLCEAMRATRDLGIRENIVQLLWDLEAHNKRGRLEPEDIQALLSVLEATTNALIASHILHLLHHSLARADADTDARPMTPEQMQICAQCLVDEIAAHKHHLQDAAQYTLGNLMALLLGDSRVSAPQRQAMVARLLEELRRTTTPGQCQVVLTVLSCMAGESRVRSAMAHCQARRRLMDFGQRAADPRLRARAMSLVKILHKQEILEASGTWYFGGGGSLDASPSSSPPSH